MQHRRAARALVAGVLLSSLVAAGGAAAELWRWIDADGVARFTPDPGRVPASRRSTLVRVEAGMPPAPEREPAVAKPPAIFAPPGDPTLVEDPWNAPPRARAAEGAPLRDPDEIVVELSSSQPPPAPTPLSPELETRRAELAAAIARDEEALKAYVSTDGDASIVASPELREIAERLPALQAELRALDARRAAP